MLAKDLPDSVLNEAARALGLASCDLDLGDAIREACQSYLVTATNPLTTVRRQQITKQLSNIVVTAQTLKGLLARPAADDESDTLGNELSYHLYVASDGRLDHRKFSYWIDELTELEHSAQRAIPLVPGEKGGRTPDIEFHVLVAKLKGLFKRAIGKAPGVTWNEYEGLYTGKFFAFVAVIEEALARQKGVPPRSNRALGELLKVATRRRALRTRQTAEGA